MTRTEYREHLDKMIELMEEVARHANELKDMVWVDGRFIKRIPGGFDRIEGEVIPKWERISLTCIWGEVKTLETNLHTHRRNQEQDKDEFETKGDSK